MEDEKCVALTHKTIQNYLLDSFISFRYIIQRKDEHDLEEKKKKSATSVGSTDSKSTKEQSKPPNPFVFKNKGQIKPNNTRSSSSLPSGGGGGSTGGTKRQEALPPPPQQPSSRSSINRTNDAANVSPCYSPCINKDEIIDVSVL